MHHWWGLKHPVWVRLYCSENKGTEYWSGGRIVTSRGGCNHWLQVFEPNLILLSRLPQWMEDGIECDGGNCKQFFSSVPFPCILFSNNYSILRSENRSLFCLDWLLSKYLCFVPWRPKDTGIQRMIPGQSSSRGLMPLSFFPVPPQSSQIQLPLAKLNPKSGLHREADIVRAGPRNHLYSPHILEYNSSELGMNSKKTRRMLTS